MAGFFKTLTGHPLHPVAVHGPMGLWGSSFVWDLLGLYFQARPWWELAFWCMLLGLPSALVAVITGLPDYLAIPDGHPARRTADRHAILMLSAAGLFALSLLFRKQAGSAPPLYPWSALACSWTGLVLLLAGGWFGGHLVYHHGIGRKK